MPTLHERPHQIVRDQMLRNAVRLENLAADIRRMADGNAPLPSDLLNAPVLDRWQILRRPVSYLVGISTGHPRLPDGPIFTSDISMMDPEFAWVRTMSRFYVLGDRAVVPPAQEGGDRG